MLIEPHLNLTELYLQPGGEWTPDGRCWNVTRMGDGFGYCLHESSAHELKTGDLVITGPNLQVTLRASQLGEVRIEFFRVVPQRLGGLITVLEWRQLEGVAAYASSRVFYYSANEAPARKFARLALLPERDSLAVRSALLQLWASCVGGVLHADNGATAQKKNLEAVFRRFISKISEQDLASTSMADMAAQLNCSERHLSRLFRAEFGMSLREKQIELNLLRACQLLSNPDAKVRSVAHDMGYPHVSFFNSSFKKRFGMTPKEWRERNLQGTLADEVKREEILPAQGGIGAPCGAGSLHGK
jgi:AraC-like DNA-binding protein